MAFQPQTALVTGATGGIGTAIAHRLAEAGLTLCLHYHSDAPGAQRLADALAGDGHVTARADLTDRAQVEQLAAEAEQALGPVDVLVNNAGLYSEHPPLEVAPETWEADWERTLALNLLAPARLCYRLGRTMAHRGGGAIVNISSRGAYRGEPDAPAYGASKAGLNALTGSLAQALGPRGVTVAGVAPGFVATPMVEGMLAGPQGEAIRAQSPMGRVARPAEVAEVVALLASGRAPFTTGTVVDVNGASYLRG